MFHNEWTLLGCCKSEHMPIYMLSASFITLEINEFGCYEAKIEESERSAAAMGRTQDTHGLSCQCSATEPPQSVYMYCTGGTECLSCTPGSHRAFSWLFHLVYIKLLYVDHYGEYGLNFITSMSSSARQKHKLHLEMVASQNQTTHQEFLDHKYVWKTRLNHHHLTQWTSPVPTRIWFRLVLMMKMKSQTLIKSPQT